MAISRRSFLVIVCIVVGILYKIYGRRSASTRPVRRPPSHPLVVHAGGGAPGAQEAAGTDVDVPGEPTLRRLFYMSSNLISAVGNLFWQTWWILFVWLIRSHVAPAPSGTLPAGEAATAEAATAEAATAEAAAGAAPLALGPDRVPPAGGLAVTPTPPNLASSDVHAPD